MGCHNLVHQWHHVGFTLTNKEWAHVADLLSPMI